MILQATINYKSIWKVALPIILSNVALNVITVTDTVFLGQLNHVALGAAGNAGIFYFVLILTGVGLSTGAQIIMGRRNGEKNFAQIGAIFDQTIYLLSFIALLVFLFLHLVAPYLLEQITSSPAIYASTIEFLYYRSFGVLFHFLNFVFIAFYIGTTNTKVLIRTTIVMMLVNVFFDYVLIFGHYGFPRMEVKGAAIASVLAEVVAFFYLVGYTKRNAFVKQFELFKFRKINWEIINKTTKIGSPIMLQNFLAISSWFIFFVIIEKLGEKELAISHIIRSIYMVLMIPLFGFSSATNTLVSNLIGQKREYKVMTLIKRVLVLSLCSTMFLGLLSLLFGKQIIGFYTPDINLINDAIPTLRVINLTMFFFCIAFILFNGVSGTGNTKVSLLIEATTISIYLVAAYFIAIEFKASLPVVWCSEFIYFGLLGLFSLWYLKKGNWRKLKI
ncbi:MAG: MATE family efflux transporter [Flavobacteriales bacterium CG18_big_fil_WC_8_21_14_2_50_32_9]|nr:MAG: MATE family efflux transporter [Flavobacteriales bacterium CG18_big_fil_WC_8_21_14_2_50_32_9]